MAIEVKKKEGESMNSFIYRFNKRIQRSGLIKEVRKRQFRKRPENRGKRRASALYSIKKQKEILDIKKYGYKK